ncbi:hypothetical protein BZG36_03624 [Bifiguratus adelaidae]|uniref:dual-specificity kinase n=1 Tax=Bifiguratus adelaidae TaxID=1938954 RepID=A0A261Y0B3_9FUNG|nr:hypothetical protein BZG36_03624 [Bifiguratus adelaidae]
MAAASPRRKRPAQANWQEDFYRNGYPREVIIIEDTPTPPPSRSTPTARKTQHHNGSTAVTENNTQTGSKRTRKQALPPPPSYAESELLYTSVSSSTAGHRTSKRRKKDVPDTRTNHDYAVPYAAPYSNEVKNGHDYSRQAGYNHAHGQYRSPREAPTNGYVTRDVPVMVNPYMYGSGPDRTYAHEPPRNQVANGEIIRAVQKYRDASKIEIKVLNTLKDRDPLNLNKCLHLLGCFDYRNHICMVFELLGMSMFDFLKENEFCPFPPHQIQQFAKQLLVSVAFLHELRLVHTDLKPENILLTSSEYHIVPFKGTKQRSNRASTAQPTTSRVLNSTDIRLIDFGSATFEDDYHSSVVSTRHYRAPEIILSMGWSFPCDIWSIGCILVEFYTGDALFQTHDNLEHLAMMEAVLGKFSDKMIRQAKNTQGKYFRGGKLDYPNDQTTKTSRKYVKAMKPLKDIIQPTSSHRKHFLDLLQRLLTYDPRERITAQEALKHPYFWERIEDDECNCASLGSKCQYLDTVRKRGPPKGYIEALETRLASVLGLAERLLHDGHSDQTIVRSMINELTAPFETPSGAIIHAKRSSKLQIRQQLSLSELRGSDPNDGTSASSTISPSSSHEKTTPVNGSSLDDDDSEDDGDDLDSVNDAFGSLSIDEANSVRYLGHASGFYLLKQSHVFRHGAFHFSVRGFRKLSLLKYEAEFEIQPGIVNPLDLPPPELSRKLLQVYFEYFHTTFPVFGKEQFLESLDSPVHQRPLLLLNAVYALASRMHQDPATRSIPKVPETAGEIFFQRAKRLLDDDYDMSRITTVQALLLMAIHQNGVGSVARGWLYAGMAFRMAQDLGLNRNSESWNIRPEERETRKRVFWSCYILDRYWACIYGRSLTFDKHDTNVPYPSVADCMPNKHATKVGAALPHLLQFIKLSQITEKVLRKIYTTRSKIPKDGAFCQLLSDLNHALITWHERLPLPLQLPERLADIQEQQLDLPLSTAILHMAYYTVMILSHRPFIPSNEKRDTSFPLSVPHSLKICVSAANSILQLAVIIHDRGQVRYLHQMAIYALFTAGIIFIHNATNPYPQLTVQGKINVNRTMQVLDELQKTWPTACRISNLLGDLVGLREILVQENGMFRGFRDLTKKEENNENQHTYTATKADDRSKREQAISTAMADERRSNSGDLPPRVVKRTPQKPNASRSLWSWSVPSNGSAFSFPLESTSSCIPHTVGSNSQGNNSHQSSSGPLNANMNTSQPQNSGTSLSTHALAFWSTPFGLSSIDPTQSQHNAQWPSDPLTPLIFSSPKRGSTSVSNDTPSFEPIPDDFSQAFQGVPFSNDVDEWNAYMDRFSMANSISVNSPDGTVKIGSNLDLNPYIQSANAPNEPRTLKLEGFETLLFCNSVPSHLETVD